MKLNVSTSGFISPPEGFIWADAGDIIQQGWFRAYYGKGKSSSYACVEFNKDNCWIGKKVESFVQNNNYFCVIKPTTGFFYALADIATVEEGDIVVLGIDVDLDYAESHPVYAKSEGDGTYITALGWATDHRTVEWVLAQTNGTAVYRRFKKNPTTQSKRKMRERYKLYHSPEFIKAQAGCDLICKTTSTASCG